MTRSYLFVPGSSERKLAKALQVGADALIVDLEDGVAAAARPAARQLTVEFLSDTHEAGIWVRINPLHSVDALPDLQAVIAAEPAGIVMPKVESARDLRQLSLLIEVLEMENGLDVGQTALLPIVTETPAALFRLHEYGATSPRLQGLTWGAEDLSASVGASACRDAAGHWLPPYELARSLTLFAAGAAAVDAIDTVFTDFRNQRGLASYAAAARRDGFDGMLAIHPDQIDAINNAFTPSAKEIARAEEIVKRFAAQPDQGAIAMNGEMLDRPHLLQAQKILDAFAKISRKTK